MLEEERNLGVSARVADAACSGQLHRPIPRPGLTTCDHPADFSEVDAVEWAEQGLTGQEPHRGWHVAKVVYAAEGVRVLDGDPHPQVVRPVQFVGNPAQPQAAFG